jgi:D-alanine--poly(phosphoribitol) ligase subunit 1
MNRPSGSVMESSALRFASQADIDRVAEFNHTDAPFPDRATLQELIEAQFAQNPEATAVICEHDHVFGASSLSCAELNKKANQLAHLLRTVGIRPGDIVALMVERSFAMMIGILGIIKSGAAYLPLSPDNPAARTDYMLKDAGVKVVLVHGKTTGKISFQGRIVDLDDPGTYRGPEENPVVVNTPADLAYVIYTSGSTGKPKGVMIEHHSVVNRLHWMQSAYPIDRDDVILQKTPYYFDVSVWELFWWALQGAKLCFLAPGAEAIPQAIIETIRKHRVTVLHFVPSMLNVFLEYLDGKEDRVVEGLASVRQVFASGEALTPSHVRKFNNILGKKIGTKLTNLYGPTEATVDVSYHDCPNNDVEIVPIGRPIQNLRLYVMRDGQHVAMGEPGELCIAGVGLARGYLNNQALTDEKFVENPAKAGERIYRTGDIARWLPDGNLEYMGREDSQIKIRGLRIELGEIESTIRDFPGIAECVCVTRKYSDNVILIIAYLVCKSEVELDRLTHYLKNHLPAYSVPNHFVILAEIPLMPNGKMDRKALPDPVIQLKGCQ